MLFIAQVNQARVATLGVRMNDAVRLYSAANNGLHGLSGTIGYDLCVDIATALEDAKYRSFAVSTAAPFPFDASGTEV
jgi:hypothetical protein